MSLAVQGRQQQGAVPMGQNGRVRVWGQFKWSTTDATGLLPMPLRRVEHIAFTPMAAPNTDEQHYVSAPTASDGGLVVPASGVLTIGRTGTKTSNLVVSYEAVGE